MAISVRMRLWIKQCIAALPDGYWKKRLRFLVLNTV
jgi:hypothetical protein